MDATLTDIWTPWFERYNNDYDDDLKLEQIKDFLIDVDSGGLIKPECGEKFFEYLNEDFYLGLEPLPGVKEAVASMHYDHGWHVKIATALPWRFVDPGVAKAKIIWLMKHFKFLKVSDINIITDKEFVPADAFVDDWPFMLSKYRAEHPHAVLAALEFPYNRDVVDPRDVFLAKNWDQILSHFESRLA